MSIMATALNVVDVDLQKLSGCFDVDSVPSYNLLNLGRFVVNSFENTFNVCCELKLLNTNRTCGRCRRALKLSLDRRDDHATPVVFRCYNTKCQRQYYSIRDGSLFESSRLSVEQIVVIANLFCANICSYEQIRYQAQLTDDRLSFETVADWLTSLREVCLDIIARETPKLTGGPGLTVEVDESKFGKRKYNKGRLVEGQWVVGGI